MRIHNVDGAGDTVCQCESWLEHWDRFSGQSPTYCPVAECMNRIEIGAHVQKDGSIGGAWYIIPLCQKHHARKGESLQVNDNVKLVKADSRGTCG